MPISRATKPTPAPTDEAGAYRAALTDFKTRHVSGHGPTGAAQAFHAVRNMPYFSGADRTALAALVNGRGACTAKHIVLRDLLRDLGYAAEVELVACDFTTSIPVDPSMSNELRALVAAAGVRDVHCWVRCEIDGQGLRLDATWPDSLKAYDFAVNDDWVGAGDTRPAAEGAIILATAEDVIAKKVELLAELPSEAALKRKLFLGVLSAWLEKLPVEPEGGS